MMKYVHKGLYCDGDGNVYPVKITSEEVHFYKMKDHFFASAEHVSGETAKVWYTRIRAFKELNKFRAMTNEDFSSLVDEMFFMSVHSPYKRNIDKHFNIKGIAVSKRIESLWEQLEPINYDDRG